MEALATASTSCDKINLHLSRAVESLKGLRSLLTSDWRRAISALSLSASASAASARCCRVFTSDLSAIILEGFSAPFGEEKGSSAAPALPPPLLPEFACAGRLDHMALTPQGELLRRSRLIAQSLILMVQVQKAMTQTKAQHLHLPTRSECNRVLPALLCEQERQVNGNQTRSRFSHSVKCCCRGYAEGMCFSRRVSTDPGPSWPPR